MGSKARVVLYAPDEERASEAASAAFGEMERLNAVLSDYDPSSEAMRLCAMAPGVWRGASIELVDVLEKSRDIWEASGGAFDPTIGPLTRLWREARRTGTAPDALALEGARARVGMGLVEVDASGPAVRFGRDGVRLDFGGIGKGYACDAALRKLRTLGYASALVEIGGDMTMGAPPPGAAGWRIEADTAGEREALVLHDCAVATSGDAFRSVTIDGVRRSHILDPRDPSGLGLTRRIGVTVVAPEGWLADALASAVSVLGEADGRVVCEAFDRVRVIVVEVPSPPAP